MLKVKKFVFGPFSENTYVVYEPASGEALVIDPGNIDPYEDKILFDYVEKNGLFPKYIVITHSHIDHILGVKCLKEKFNSVILAPEKDMPLLQHAKRQGEMFGIPIEDVPAPDEYISVEKALKLGSSTGKFLFTPGHTPGEHCLFLEQEKVIFTGDVLFRESIGRTDLWGGNFQTLMDSISGVLLNLPDEVIVYPGHGEETTIGHEKNNNPFLNEFTA